MPAALRPRILIVTTYFPPSHAIASRRTRRLATHLDRLGWTVTVLAPPTRHAGPVDPADLPPDGIELVRTRMFAPPLLLRSASREARVEATRDAALRLRRALLRRLVPAGRVLLGWWPRTQHPDPWARWIPSAVGGVEARRFDVVPGAVGEEFNIASGVERRICDVAARINELTGSPAGVVRAAARPWDTKQRLLASIERAKAILGYETETSFDEGLRRTVDWFRERWQDIERDAKFPPGATSATPITGPATRSSRGT